MPRLAAGLCFIALLATRSEAAVEAGPRAASPARPISPSSVATPCPNSCALVDYISGSQDYSCSANPRADMTRTNTSASYDLRCGGYARWRWRPPTRPAFGRVADAGLSFVRCRAAV